MKLKPIKPRDDGGGVPITAGCAKCDNQMGMADDVHHEDGSVCAIMARNFRVMDRGSMAPLGRYDPAKDPYVTITKFKESE